MKGTIRQQIEGLKAELRPERIIVVAVGLDQDVQEPTFYAVGGSDEARERAIAEASRRWRAQHAEKSGGS